MPGKRSPMRQGAAECATKLLCNKEQLKHGEVFDGLTKGETPQGLSLVISSFDPRLLKDHSAHGMGEEHVGFFHATYRFKAFGLHITKQSLLFS